MEEEPSKRSKFKDALSVLAVNLGIRKLHVEDGRDYNQAKRNVLWLEAGFDRLRHTKKRVFVMLAAVLFLRGRKRRRHKRKRP